MDTTLFTLITQGGAFALLVYLAIWLTKWLPSAFQNFMDRQDKMLEVFQEQMKLERFHCESRFERIYEKLK